MRTSAPGKHSSLASGSPHLQLSLVFPWRVPPHHPLVLGQHRASRQLASLYIRGLSCEEHLYQGPVGRQHTDKSYRVALQVEWLLLQEASLIHAQAPNDRRAELPTKSGKEGLIVPKL